MTESEQGPALSREVADAEHALRKRRVGSLVVVIALGVAAVVGLMVLVGGDDRARVYGEIGRTINGLERAHFDQFWACAIPGENLSNLRSNADLVFHVGGRSRERGRAYGLHVRETCLPKLEAIGPKLDTLIVPEDLQADVRALGDANGELRSAFSGFVAYLDDPDLAYAEADAKPHLQRIARAWYDFKTAHAAINQTIKAKL